MADVIPAPAQVDPDEAYQAAVARRRALSLSGEQPLAPDELWLPITENCNFRCVGCFREGMFKKTYLSIEEARRILEDNDGHKFRNISLTSGEGFLHPGICDIIELCKEMQPQAIIDMVSNGSIPPKGRFAKAISMIDDLCLSIDGCTKETFESIRVGGNFDKFIANAKAIVAIRDETGYPKKLSFCFTAMTKNIGELPGVVDLAADLGVTTAWAQPMEMDPPEIRERVGQYHLTNMPLSEIHKIVARAKWRGKERGVKVGLAGFLWPETPGEDPALQDKSKPVDSQQIARDIQHCQYPYTEAFGYIRAGDKFHVLPCCYMSEDVPAMMAERYGLEFDHPPSVKTLYNSEAFWRFRTDLAAGRANDLCGNCLQARSFPWHGEK